MQGVRAATNDAPVYAWDVVNEAVTWVSGQGWVYRDGPWYPVLDNYIHKAFTYARDADPDALLFYNDFSLETSEGKTNAVVAMIQEMQDSNVPIDGVGLQYHVDIWDTEVTRESTAALIKTFGDMGLQVHITEMDVTLCEQLPCDGNDAVALATQAQMYEDALAACFFDNPGVCTAFLTWGFAD